jgi:hypothetical protein
MSLLQSILDARAYGVAGFRLTVESLACILRS